MNAIRLLTDDHKKVRGLLAELEETTTRGVKTRRRLLQEIAKEVRVHSKIEEEIFYPAFRDAAQKDEDSEMFFEAKEEHHVVDLVLPELEETDPGTDEFSARAKVLKELIEHHAGEEEKEMFVRARKLLDPAELEDLGRRMQERKDELVDGVELERPRPRARRMIPQRSPDSPRTGSSRRV
jgi:hypothetical protein